MIKPTFALFFFIILLPLTLLSDDFEIAVEEYKQGEFEKALFLFEKSCDSGNRQGCFNLAVMYKHGQGIVPNRQKSEALFALACRGDVKECHFNTLNES